MTFGRTLAMVATLACLVSGAGAARFSAQTLVGSWSGTWTNVTFGSTGTLAAEVTAPDDNTIVMVADVNGNTFGCTDPDPVTLTLVSGVDWTPKGLKFTRQGPAFGTYLVKLLRGGKKLSAKSTAPTCQGFGPNWSAKGKVKRDKFSGRMTIRFQDGSKATATFSATRS